MEEPNPLPTNLKCRGWWNCDGEAVAGACKFLLSSVGTSKLGRRLRRRRFVVEREGLDRCRSASRCHRTGPRDTFGAKLYRVSVRLPARVEDAGHKMSEAEPEAFVCVVASVSPRSRACSGWTRSLARRAARGTPTEALAGVNPGSRRLRRCGQVLQSARLRLVLHATVCASHGDALPKART